MSVLVKGMEMPKCCGYCPFEHKKYCMAKPSLMVESTERHPRCPLVEVDDNEIDEAIKALKGVRDAHRIITEAFCRPPETDIGSKPK